MPSRSAEGELVYSAEENKKIPYELKRRRQWVCYCIEERDGKQTKIPYAAQGGLASATDPETWTTYREAVKRARSAGMSGIGFVFSTDDLYTGIDLDDCRNPQTGEIEQWAQDFIEELASYTELSPSGTGVHVFVKATLPEGGSRKKKWIEVYDRSRFFTVTGERLEESPSKIHERQAELDALHRRVFPPDQAPAPTESPDSVDRTSISDEEIVRRAKNAKNGAKFSDLWAGRWEGYGYPSQSEAEQALCSLLAWWTGPDEGRIANLVSQSGMYRPKWDRADYRNRTIQGALAVKTEFWEGPGRSMGTSGERDPQKGRSHLQPVPDPPGEETATATLELLCTPGYKNLAVRPDTNTVYKLHKTKKGYEPVSQGYEAPRVLERIRVPGEDVTDGKRLHYLLEHEGTQVQCSYEELTRGSVWEKVEGLEFLGADRTSIGDGAALVLRLAKEAPTYTGHNTTGWQEFEDGSGSPRFGYVLPDGRALCAGEENISRARTVDIPAGLRTQFDTGGCDDGPASASDEDIKEALQAVRLAAPGRLQALLALGSSARALSGGIRRAGLTTIIEGERSTGKTSIAALARSLIVPYSWPPKPEMSFNDTVNSLEKRVARLGSYPALIDDFNIPPNATQKTISEGEKKLELIVRNTYNDADMKGRLNRDTTERASSKVQTAALITAERLPDSLQSFLRRVLLLPIEEDEAKLDLLADSERYAPALMALGQRLVIDLANRVEEHGREHAAGEIRETHRHYMNRLRGELTAAMDGSLPQMFTSLPEIGAETLTGLYHLERAANLPEGELTEPALQSLTAILVQQAGRMEGREAETGAGPFTQLAEMLAEHLRAGTPIPGTGSMPTRAVSRETADVPEKAPQLFLPGAEKAVPAHVWGCGGEEEDGARRPVTVAFVDEVHGILYLTETAMAAMLEWARKMAGCGHITTTAKLTKAAEEEGWLKRRETNKRVVKPRHRGDNKARALAVCALRFVGEDEQSPPRPPQQPQPPEPDFPDGSSGGAPEHGGKIGLPTSPPACGEGALQDSQLPEIPDDTGALMQEQGELEDRPETPEREADGARAPDNAEPSEWALDERVRKVLEKPWAAEQAANCRSPGGGRLIKPLASSVSHALSLQSEHERAAVLRIVDAHVRGEEYAG